MQKTSTTAARSSPAQLPYSTAKGTAAASGLMMSDVTAATDRRGVMKEKAQANTRTHNSDSGRQKELSAVGQLLAGGTAGAVSKTATAPLARLTILFQIQGMVGQGGTYTGSGATAGAAVSAGAAPTTGRPRAPGMAVEVGRILREEGLRAFWKGNGATVVHRFPYGAINFLAYEKYKAALRVLHNDDRGRQDKHSDTRRPADHLLAGGAAGLTAASLAYPMDVVRTRLAAQRTYAYYRGLAHALATIARDEGLRGLYKGLGASLLQVGPSMAITFCAYDTLKTLLCPDPMSISTVDSLACGATAALASSTATFPLELVRRRLQLRGAPTAPADISSSSSSSLLHDNTGYKTGRASVVGALKHVVRTEGWKGLYRGLLPEALKVVPTMGINFMTYEFLKSVALASAVATKTNA